MDNNDEEQLLALKKIIEGIKTAHKRGAYTMEESAELWKYIKHFIEE
mgnify:FL=1|jgi:hypothetical protein